MNRQHLLFSVIFSFILLVRAGSPSSTAAPSGSFTDYGQPVSGARSVTALTLAPNGLIYGVTCNTHLFVFNPGNQTFTDKGVTPGSCPLALTWGPDGLLYGGGWQSVLWSYDPQTGTFSTRGHVPGGRRIIGLATGRDGRIYVGTEPEADPEAKGRLFAFTPNTNTFTDLGGIAAEVSVGYGLITGPDGKIYGGTFRGGHFFVYDPDNGTLTDKGQPMPGISSVSTLTVGNDGKIYGGINGNGHVFAYDPATDTFADKGQAVAGHTRVVSLVALGSKVYGGTDGLAAGTDGHLFVYDMAAETFTDLGAPVSGERKVSSLVIVGLTVYGGTAFQGHFFAYDASVASIFLPIVSR